MPGKKKIHKILLVYKRSPYQKYVLDEDNENILKLIKNKNDLVKNWEPSHEKHKAGVKEIVNYLKKTGIPFDTESRHTLRTLKDYDLIITAGGDGTFLRTARIVKDQRIIGINTLPRGSVGALCTTIIRDFKEKLDDVFAGKSQTRQLTRMQISINDKVLRHQAVNDVLFTNASPAATSRYFLSIGSVQEEHKSSGIWISTATGSTAAIKAAGGLSVPREDNRLQYVVREPYQGVFNPYRLIRGFVNEGKSIKIQNKMTPAKVYIDGPTHSHTLAFGDVVRFETSKTPLNIII